MKPSFTRFFFVIVLLGVIAGGLYWIYGPATQEAGDPKKRGERTVPVEVGPIVRGAIELRRTFSGALEPRTQFVLAPKVSGRLERLSVNISDFVQRGELVGELENDEYVQSVTQARANLAVAQANLSEARSELGIANRELERVETLKKRGVASESQLDSARANQLAKQAKSEVAEANVSRAESLLETENIRLRYTRIIAEWSGGKEKRVVAERFVDEGEMVSANTPLLRIVEIDPIIGVIFVTERDYARLQPGQRVTLSTDAYPGEYFNGSIARIAPIFRKATRQARVELLVDNNRLRLKPGMFIRATIILDQKSDAVLIPEEALTKRNDRMGVFKVSEDGRSVSWTPVNVGIRDGNAVQVEGEQLSGRVVTLGQQLLEDGSKISIPAEEPASTETTGKAANR
jgi:RND family efflux transporter MFP subunit